MRRKVGYFMCGLIIALVAGYIFRDQITWKVISLLIKPGASFDEASAPTPPDYSQAESWAALPGRSDNADVVPAGGEVDNQADAAVDVFFLHPTTYYDRKSWNQPLDDEKANDLTDRSILRNQAAAFNGSARVYAPRYRQATLYSFMDSEGNGPKALDLAYADVRAAFEYYLGNYNEGRPIIVASHSQGSRHGARLLEDYFAEEPLRSKLVAAYLVGWSATPPEGEGEIAGIAVCDSPDQTGCWLTWNAMGPDANRERIAESAVCVNPLTWRTDGELAKRELNLGGVVFGEEEDEAPGTVPEIVSAQCKDGVLWISSPEGDGYSYMPMGSDNYHIYDYNLFYMNIRRNVEKRVEAYLARTPVEPAQ